MSDRRARRLEAGTIDTVRSAWERCLAQTPEAHLFHSPAWIAATASGRGRWVSLGITGDGPAGEGDWSGFFNARVGADALAFTVADRPWWRIHVTAAAIAFPGWPVPSRSREWTAAFQGIFDALPEVDMIRLDAVPINHPLFDELVSRKIRVGHVYSPRQISVRHQIDRPAEPLKRPQNYRKKWNRLSRDLGEVSIRLYRAPSEIEDFLGIARGIHAQSWQAMALGPSPWLADGAQVVAAAEHDCVSGAVLFAGEKPLAFDLGFVFAGTYLRMETAFVQEHVYHSPGMLGLYAFIDAAFADDRGVTLYDFGHGHYDYKAKIATRHIQERFVFIYRPGRWKFRALTAAHAAYVAVYNVLRDGLKKSGFVRRLRSRTTTRPEKDDESSSSS